MTNGEQKAETLGLYLYKLRPGYFDKGAGNYVLGWEGKSLAIDVDAQGFFSLEDPKGFPVYAFAKPLGRSKG